MMNDESCKKILAGLGGGPNAQKAEPYIRSRIHLYIYLYLLAEAGEQAAPSADVTELLAAVRIPEDIRSAIQAFAAGTDAFAAFAPFAGADAADFSRCTKENITALFEQVYASFVTSYTTTGTPETLYRFIGFLLAPGEADDIADFYGNTGFAGYLCNQHAGRSVSCFEPLVEDWLFARMYAQLTGIQPGYRCLQRDLSGGTDGLAAAFSKIYAFPPFYQKMTVAESTNNVRIVRNMQRSPEDRTTQLISQVLDCLADGGRAVVLVSNALFTRNYAAFHRQLLEDGFLTQVINLPQGAVYPRNVSASFLLFEKQEGNKGIRFVDLRSFTSEAGALAPAQMPASKTPASSQKPVSSQMPAAFQTSAASEASVSSASAVLSESAGASQMLIDLLAADDSAYSVFVPYEQITAADCDLNSSSYIGRSSPDSRPPFILGKEAQIFRGLQDMDSFKILQKQDIAGDSHFYGSDRYLRITDIEENRIQDTMPYIEWQGREPEKFMLTNRDVIISKTAVPVKVAVPEVPFIYPAGNIFIIRLNENSVLNRYYLKCFLESEEGLRRLRMLSSGSSLVSFTKGSLGRLEIPYKSALEQKSLEERYRTSEARIRQLEAELKKIKQEQKGYIASF
ncbi:MAG: N-6 DNA methylase [Treponema sp.]|nr:N-6 DNA methylase [Treponema sp.]